jgi:hypothetical protein
MTKFKNITLMIFPFREKVPKAMQIEWTKIEMNMTRTKFQWFRNLLLQIHLVQWLARSGFLTGILVFCVGIHCISFLRPPVFLYLMDKLVHQAGKETEFGKSVPAPGTRASAKSSEAPPLQMVMLLLYYGSPSYI